MNLNLLSNKNNILQHIAFNCTALMSMLFLTDIFAVCGTSGEVLMVYQTVAYVPQAIVMLIAPFLCYVTYAENISSKWKIIKFAIIGALFTFSLITTLKFGISALEAEYGSAESRILVFPILFYCSIALGILTEINSKEINLPLDET